MIKYESSRNEIVKTAQSLVEKGYLNSTGGNISVRIPGEPLFAVTPSDYDYMLMKPEDVCILGLDMAPVDVPMKASVESAMHAAIYTVRPDVHAIIHTHQVYPSTLALMQKPIPTLFDEQARFLGREVRIIPYMPSGTPLLKNMVKKHVQDHNNAYLMANHGALVFGTDMLRAFHNVAILDKCSLAYLLTLVSDVKTDKIPAFVREIAFSKLRKDQKKAEEV